MNRALLRDAAAPLTLLAVMALIAVMVVDIWAAVGTSAFLSNGVWTAPHADLALLVALARNGPAGVLAPDTSPGVFVVILSVEALAQIVAGTVGWLSVARRFEADRSPERALLHPLELGDLTGDAAQQRARALRPDMPTHGESSTGVRLLSIGRHDVWMSWEDVALVVMGPRSNKTSAIAVPTVLTAPGLVVATSNKADLWALTSGLRGGAGPVWTFDPQRIAHAPQTWWWDPLRSIRDATRSERTEAAARLAAHFMHTIGGTRRDPFFHTAGEQLLTTTLLAAAVSGGTIRDAIAWLQPGQRQAVAALDDAGEPEAANDLESTLNGADVTTKGIMQTARTATRALSSERILRWITPPESWTEPPRRVPAELDVWDMLAAGRDGPATVHMLSKEGAGTAAPVVTAFVDRILEVAELAAQAAGGRLEPPVVAVLDEAANICPIRQLPQLYSHYGSRGIQVLTMLQSYQQGVGVWGEQGMQALWSAATIKLVGAGVDDHAFLQRLAGLVGDRDVEKVSTSIERSRGPSRQYSTTREPILPAAALRALPRDQAILLATGRRAGLGRLRPWYRERDSADISEYSTTALTELRAAAAEALGPDNPILRPREVTT